MKIMMMDKLPRSHERQQQRGSSRLPPPPPFPQTMDSPSSRNARSSSPMSNRRRPSSSYQANSFAPPPFDPPSPSSRASRTAPRRRNPPPPPRRPMGAGSRRSSHEIIHVSLQRPMGIVFAPNEEVGYGVRIIDMPQQGAAAISQQLCIGDVLISVNGRDCATSNSKEVMALIGQAEGYVDLSFRRISAAAENVEESPKSPKLMQVVSLKWQDITSGLHGRYDGTVNQHMRPHGYGKFTADNHGERIEGEWEDGILFEGVKSPARTAVNDHTATNSNDVANAAAAAGHPMKRRNSHRNHESMSYATSIHNSAINLSDYPDAQQQQQQTNSRRQSKQKEYDSSSSQSSSSLPLQQHQQQQQFYCLGETLRSQQHMVQLASVEDTIQSVYALQIADFAFVKRSSGDWSFCQLIERENNEEGEDVMTFCVNEVGHRKSLRPCRWVKMVRSCSNGVTVRPGGAAMNRNDDSMESADEPSF